MSQMLHIVCMFLLVAAVAPMAQPEATTSEATPDCTKTTEGVTVNVNVDKSSCVDVQSRLSAIEGILQRIEGKLGNAVSATEAPTQTPVPVLQTCQELLQNGFSDSGVYTIDPKDGQGPFDVYCDMTTDEGGWLVFQRRQDGSENFFQRWTDYKSGFGNLSGEFWLGLDKIHRLTKSSNKMLRFDLRDFDGNSRYAEYRTFTVGDEASGYVLASGYYSGTAGDSFTHHSGRQFSTKDIGPGRGCATTHKGAWWYAGCHYSNLNGIYYKGTHESFADGVNWYHWKKFNYSLKFTEMKMRPK